MKIRMEKVRVSKITTAVSGKGPMQNLYEACHLRWCIGHSGNEISGSVNRCTTKLNRKLQEA